MARFRRGPSGRQRLTGSAGRRSFAFLDQLSIDEIEEYIEDNIGSTTGEDLLAYIKANHLDFGIENVSDLSESEFWILYRKHASP